MMLRLTRRDALRGGMAASHAAAAREGALALFEAGGHAILPAPVQGTVRAAIEREASRVLAGAGLLESGAIPGARLLERGTARTLAVQSGRAAGRQVLRSVGKAAGAGAVLDGGWALVQAIRGVRAGSMTRREATVHVVREASTGAAATAIGTAAAIGLVALTGGVAAPALFFVGAAASMGAKAGLDRWLKPRRIDVVVAASVEPATA